MEKQKDFEKNKPKDKKRKSRAEVLTPTDFFKKTKESLLASYSPEEQNDIIKELYFAVRENRAMEIDKLKSDTENLCKLNEEIMVGK